MADSISLHPAKVTKLSVTKIANLLNHEHLEDATQLRKYDYFENLIRGVVGSKSNMKLLLEVIFKDLEQVFAKTPNDSKDRMQNVLHVFAKHIDDPKLFLETISYVKGVNKKGQEGYYLKLDGQVIRSEKAFFLITQDINLVFKDPSAEELKLKFQTIETLLAKIQCLKTLEGHELTNLSDLQKGDVVIFVRNKRDKNKIDPIGRVISFLSSLTNSEAVFGHNRSTHVAIVTQGKENFSEKNPPKDSKIKVTHMIGKGLTTESLEDYINHGGEKRTLFVFRPKDASLAKELSEASKPKNYNPKYSAVFAGGKAMLDKNTPSKWPKSELSQYTVCSKFVAECLKKSLQKLTKKQGSKFDASINTNIVPKKLEHWLVMQSDLFEPHIYYGARKEDKTINLRLPSKTQLLEQRIKELKKEMTDAKFNGLLNYFVAENKFLIAQGQLKIEKLNLLLQMASDSTQETNNNSALKKVFLEKEISIAEMENEIAKQTLEIRILNNERFTISPTQDQETYKQLVVKINKYKLSMEPLIERLKFEKGDLLKLKTATKSKTLKILTDVQRNDSTYMENMKNFVIAGNQYRIEEIKSKVERLSSPREKNLFLSRLSWLINFMDVDHRVEQIALYEAILHRLMELEIELNQTLL